MRLISPAVLRQVVLASQVCYLSRVTLNFLTFTDSTTTRWPLSIKNTSGAFFLFFLLLLELYCFSIKEVAEDKKTDL